MSGTCLLLDATNRWIVCALKDGEGVHGTTRVAPGEASRRLIPMIQELMATRKCTRPDWIVAARGPGSFTGARITVSTARNLGQLWDVPVLGVESLVYYGAVCVRSGSHPRPGVLIDGKQNRVFARLVDAQDSPRDWGDTDVLDVAPKALRELWPEGTPLYVDDEAAVRRYMGDAWPDAPFEAMPEPDGATLFELAETLGGIDAARSYEDLVPVYARPDPAHAKYPEGYTPKV